MYFKSFDREIHQMHLFVDTLFIEYYTLIPRADPSKRRENLHASRKKENYLSNSGKIAVLHESGEENKHFHASERLAW